MNPLDASRFGEELCAHVGASRGRAELAPVVVVRLGATMRRPYTWAPDGRVSSDIREQCRQMYENVRQVLTAAGSSLDDVVSTTTYLVNASDYRALNEIRAQYFKNDPPASAVVVVKELVRPDLLVEVETVAEVRAKSARAIRTARRPAHEARSGRRR